jgi:hypothetical protein
MNQPSVIKKVVAAFSNSADAATHVSSPVALSEMPETPGLNLPDGKISTATRKKLLPFTAAGAEGAKKDRAMSGSGKR